MSQKGQPNTIILWAKPVFLPEVNDVLKIQGGPLKSGNQT